MTSGKITAETGTYCFLDLDFNHYRSKFALAAAFVDATDSRYGFSSKDLRALGGSELARLEDLIATDHEWSAKLSSDAINGSVEIRPPPTGNRIVVKLFWDVAPLACENFATLCAAGSVVPFGSTITNTKKANQIPVGESGKPLCYRKSIIHRVIKDFVLQGGDFVFGNGSGGESIFNGKKFKDERAGLALKHDRRGVLSMGNSGKNSNTSQFFITLQAAPACDGKHVVFGEVVSGWDVLRYAETFGTAGGDPTVPIIVTDCGIYAHFVTPGSGYWYDQPDAEQYSGISSVFMVRPRVALLGPNNAALERFLKSLGTFCSVVGTVNAEDWEGNEEAQADRLLEFLGNYCVDVVLVAPACKGVMDRITELPKSWQLLQQEVSGANTNNSKACLCPDISEVAMETKPVQALQCIRTKSWLATKCGHWQLDGTLQQS